MTNEEKTALDAVEKINEELELIYKDNYDKLPRISFKTSSDLFSISLFIPSNGHLTIPEFELYNSWDDDRNYNENTNTYETYYKLIKRKFVEIKKEINSVKL